jgi:hypothetical protein
VDLCKVVLQFNGEDKTLAVRPEDASSFKSNEEYTFFIGAVAIGVRRRCHTAPVPCCLTFLHHDADMLPVPRVQVSITTKKGVNLRKLVPSDFLYSRKCYWVTSSEHQGGAHSYVHSFRGVGLRRGASSSTSRRATTSTQAASYVAVSPS